MNFLINFTAIKDNTRTYTKYNLTINKGYSYSILNRINHLECIPTFRRRYERK